MKLRDMNWPAFYVTSALLSLIALTLVATNADAAGLTQQRQQYSLARHALAVGKQQEFEYLATQLQDYPLYPYLRYEELRRRISTAPEKDVRAFLDNYSYIPAARRIRKAWLDVLMKRGQHRKFQQYYERHNNVAHNCFDLQVRMSAGNAPDAIDEIKAFWLVSKSQPKQCDPLFSWLQKQKILDDDLIWQDQYAAISNHHLKSFVSVATKTTDHIVLAEIYSLTRML